MAQADARRQRVPSSIGNVDSSSLAAEQQLALTASKLLGASAGEKAVDAPSSLLQVDDEVAQSTFDGAASSPQAGREKSAQLILAPSNAGADLQPQDGEQQSLRAVAQLLAASRPHLAQVEAQQQQQQQASASLPEESFHVVEDIDKAPIFDLSQQSAPLVFGTASDESFGDADDTLSLWPPHETLASARQVLNKREADADDRRSLQDYQAALKKLGLRRVLALNKGLFAGQAAEPDLSGDRQQQFSFPDPLETGAAEEAGFEGLKELQKRIEVALSLPQNSIVSLFLIDKNLSLFAKLDLAQMSLSDLARVRSRIGE